MYASSVKAAPKREDQIQFLRFIMFFFVFSFHAGLWGVYHYPDWNGAVSAVSFFFMLSGALCGFYAKEKKCELTVKNIASDVFRKAKKLYGLYFLTTVFSIFGSEIPDLIVSYRFSELKEPVFQLVRNLLMIQSWFPTGTFSYNGVCWYLSTLMFLYTLNLPLTVLLQKLGVMPRHKLISIIGMALCFGLTVIYSYYTDVEEIHFWQYAFPPARIGQYVFGALLGFYIRSIKDKICEGRLTWLFFTVAEIGTLLFWVFSLYHSPLSWTNRLVDWFLPNMLLLGIFLIGKGGLSQLFRKKVFIKLGNMSASCYLTHQIIHFLFVTLSGIAMESRLEYLVCVVFSFLFTVAFSFFYDRA